MSEWFRNKRILVTGATGLIGSAVVDELLRINASENLGLSVVAAGRNRATLVTRFAMRDALEFVAYDALQPFHITGDVNVIIHTASPASPELFVEKPVETMLANINGINEILKYAVAHPAVKIVYVSSSEVYGKAQPRENGFREEDCGSVDILSPRSSYPMGKRAAETLCGSYASEYSVDVSIVRPGHIYGPTATEKDRRVSSLWPRMAARGETIVMKSAGTQVRSYTYCADCATAILTVCEKGVKGEAYNIANPNAACSIRHLAQTIADAGSVELHMEVPTDVEKTAFNPMDNSKLDASKLVALGWRAEYDIERGVRETIDVLKKEFDGVFSGNAK